MPRPLPAAVFLAALPPNPATVTNTTGVKCFTLAFRVFAAYTS